MKPAKATVSKSAVDVHLLLTRHGEVLLALRQGTGFADGSWNLPSGKVEAGENALAAMVREAREELDLKLGEGDVALTATVQCRNSPEDVRIGLFFHVEATEGLLGQLRNAEPHKCAEITWFPLAELPANVLDYSARGIELHNEKKPFGMVGW